MNVTELPFSAVTFNKHSPISVEAGATVIWEALCSILVISHQERILDIADEIVLVVAGKISKVGTREEIFPEIMKNTIKCKHLK